MDMLERRIRDAVATLLSRGAKALERTASDLEQAASELRSAQRRSSEAERVWAEPRQEPDTMIRSAPLRAVPDSPSDERGPTAERPVPPVRPVQPRVDAAVGGGPQAPDPGADVEPDGLRELATGTVSEIRSQLADLSPSQLRSLRQIETENRNRVTLLTAIDRALDADQ